MRVDQGLPDVADMDRDEIIEELEGTYFVACYDDESTQLLREALEECRKDGIG